MNRLPGRRGSAARIRRALIPFFLLLGLSLPGRQAPGAAEAAGPAGEVIVQLEPGAAIGAINRRYGTRVLETMPDGYYRLALPAHGGAAAYIRALDRNPDVADAQPDYTLSERFRRYFVENGSEIDPWADPYIAGYQDQWATGAIGLADALGVTAGQGITVAVIDTAVDEAHPVLSGVVDPGYSTLGAGHGVYNDAGAPHGTFVAGLIHLVAPAARIMPIEALTDDGTGTVWDVSQAIRWAADHGAQVINLSLGTAHEATVLDDAVAYAQDHGAIVVASAGNDGTGAAPHFPSDLPSVVSVAALDSGRARAPFSNYGAHVVISAPGVDTYSTFPTGGYALASGTSMATAFVSGAAALVLSAHPGIDSWTAMSIISSTARDISGSNDPTLGGMLGAGLIDAAASVRATPAGGTESVVAPAGEIGSGWGDPSVPPSVTPTPADPGAAASAIDNPPTAVVTDDSLATPTEPPPADTPTVIVPTPTDTGATATDAAGTPTETADTPTDVVADTPTVAAETPTDVVITPIDPTPVGTVPVNAL